MGNSINSLGSLPDASGYMSAGSPRQAGMVYGGYTGLDPLEEAYAQRFGQEAQNGNFWRGATLWGTGAVLAGVGTVAMERQWLKETSNAYLSAKRDFLKPQLTPEHYSLLGENKKAAEAMNNTALTEAQKFKVLDNSVKEGFIKNSYKLDNNPYKELNTLFNNANDYAKVQLNAVDPEVLAKEVKLTKTTGLAKAGMVAGAVLAGGLLISHLSASGEGNATTQMAREHLAMLKAQEAMAQRGQA